jgi:hypothetical protein
LPHDPQGAMPWWSFAYKNIVECTVQAHLILGSYDRRQLGDLAPNRPANINKQPPESSHDPISAFTAQALKLSGSKLKKLSLA